jgi:hypothetical protein
MRLFNRRELLGAMLAFLGGVALPRARGVPVGAVEDKVPQVCLPQGCPQGAPTSIQFTVVYDGYGRPREIGLVPRLKSTVVYEAKAANDRAKEAPETGEEGTA